MDIYHQISVASYSSSSYCSQLATKKTRRLLSTLQHFISQEEAVHHGNIFDSLEYGYLRY
jgi:hypothetical protein